jgi:predicted small lipoprotein YifL
MMRVPSRLVLGLALGLALAACGQKGPPLAPELVRPDPPTNLAAVATPEGVRLTWTRPTRYSGGARMHDLEGFLIERAPAEGAPAVFATAGRLELNDQERFRKDRRLEWTDRDVRAGERYLYRVTALTLDGYRSRAAGPVAIRFGSAPKESP